MAKRRTPLVCQHLENLSRDALEKYADVIRDIVSKRHGVYALYHRDKLYYVGLATNLRNRLKNHLRDRHGGHWDRFSVYLTIDHGYIKELESLVIRIVQPGGNRHSGRFVNSEDLRRTLRRKLRQKQRQEWLELIGTTDDSLDEDVEIDRTGHASRKSPKILRRTKREAVLAQHIAGPLKLRARYKGKVFKASVRADGRIRVNGVLVNTPSCAAVKITNRPMNGWTFWMYERAPGQWVKLDDLRRK